MNDRQEKPGRVAAVTVHMSAVRRDKLRVLSQLNGFGGELSPFVDSLIESAIVSADLQFQLMESVFGYNGNQIDGQDHA